MTTQTDLQREALDKAQSGLSLTNYPAIFEGFEAKGIPTADIQPRVNVFTFHAWKALGRRVKKGEHGVRVATIRKGSRVERDPATGAETTRSWSSPWYTTVFHISQTIELGSAT